jgi:hypothetical protein
MLPDAVAAALALPDMGQEMIDDVIAKARTDSKAGEDLGFAQWVGWEIDEVPCGSYRGDITRALRRVYRAAHAESAAR